MNEFFSTSNVTGSSGLVSVIGSSPHVDDDVEIFVNLGGGAGWNDHGRVDLFDHSGAGEGKAGGKVRAKIDRRIGTSLVGVEPDGPAALRPWGLTRWLVNGQFGFGNDADRLQVQPEQADRRLVATEIIFPIVLAMKRLDEVYDCSDWGRRGHGKRTPLALIHHVDGALEYDIGTRHALMVEAIEGFLLEPFKSG